jgi:hypothetical protein
MGGIAAPLLAGAGFTLAALILPTTAANAAKVCRWPDAALFCFTGSGLAQIAAVQATVWCARLTATPDQFMSWYPDEVRNAQPSQWLRNFQLSHQRQAHRWADRARFSYHLGIVLLLAGIVAVSVPPMHITAERGAVVMLTVFGLLGELAWLVVATFLNRRRRRQGLVHGLGILCAATLAVGAGAGIRGLLGPVFVGAAAGAVAVEVVLVVGRLRPYVWLGGLADGFGAIWVNVAAHVAAVAGIAAAVGLTLSGMHSRMTPMIALTVLPALVLESTYGWQIYSAERKARST